MPLKINTSLTSLDGGEISSGSYIVYDLTLPKVKHGDTMMGLKYNLYIYRDQDAFEENKKPIRVEKIKAGYYLNTLLTGQTSLSYLEINQLLAAKIETDLGEAGVVEII